MPRASNVGRTEARKQKVVDKPDLARDVLVLERIENQGNIVGGGDRLQIGNGAHPIGREDLL